MNRKEKRAQQEQEVYNRMRYYLGMNPGEVFRTAMDLTAMVARASKSKTLDLWLSQMRALTPNYAPDKPAVPKPGKPRRNPTPK